MATADVMTTMPIPGLHRPFTAEDMKKSTITYNENPRIDSEFGMNSDNNHVKGLLDIILSHDQHGKFGIHRVHRHDKIPNDTVRLESNLGIVPGKWNRATPTESLDLNNMYPVVIKYFPGTKELVPYELGEGPSTVVMTAKVDAFVKDFTGYLAEHNLSERFALEVVDPAKAGQPVECNAELEVVDVGTVVLPASMMVSKDFTIATGWFGLIQPADGEGDEPPAGTYYLKTDHGTHRVISKTNSMTAEGLIAELASQGHIKV
ncbi:hypothetical protein CIB48_g11043 [Xylaria polymorpha]|nr:hypothetical protein CIB48_g11043 [Xylaria polymorpha]